MVNDATTPHKNSNGHTVSYTYDQANNILTARKTNNGLVTNVYDAMNHVTKMTVGQAPTADAVTNNTYYPSGLLHTMQDPKLNTYTYAYDLMGRKSSLTYPDSSTDHESWTYDLAGNLGTFKNRDNYTQTFVYDNRERSQGFSWNDNSTPNVTITYQDTAPFTVTNACAYPAARTITVTDIYNDDGTLRSEKEASSAETGISRTVNYTYFANLKRATVVYPGPAHTVTYSYTPRGAPYASADNGAGVRVYGFDHNENLVVHATGSTPIWENGINFNAMDENTAATFQFVSGVRSAAYGYDAMNDRTSIARDGGAADTFGYDLNEQSTTATQSGVPSTFTYDANGNRNDNANYVVNSLNQYTKFNNVTITYDNRGNVTSDGNGTYAYDAQNRMTSATVGAVSTAFLYDGYNRKFSRAETTSGVTTTTVNIWDGWNLIEECPFGNSTPTYTYFHGIDGVEKRLGGSTSPLYYFRDALGSVTHVTDASGNLKEWYKYDRFGAASIYDGNNSPLTASAYDIRHLFTNQLWMPKVGLYDYRNRVYSPVLQRFMQTDPIGFGGDASHLYRLGGNNPINAADWTGLNVDIIVHAPVGHASWRITDPTSLSGFRYYDFGPSNGWPRNTDPVPGRWASNTSTYFGVDILTSFTTPEQDLVLRAAFNTEVSKTNLQYATCDNNCYQAGYDIADSALVRDGNLINPVDPNTGNIYDASYNWVGWENPDTGNIYDAKGNWAGWNGNWQQNFRQSSNGSGSAGGGVGNTGFSGFGTRGSGSPFAGLSFSSVNAAIAYVFWGGSTQSRIPPEQSH